MLVLASSSPRRRELLAQAGFTFTVRAAHIAEKPFLDENPISYVIRLAREKAETVYRRLCAEMAAGRRNEFKGAAEENAVSERLKDETAGAKALPFSDGDMARLKPCPDTSCLPETALSPLSADRPKPGAEIVKLPEGASSRSDEAQSVGWDLTRDLTQNLVVLGADTTVTLDNLILEKPLDAADAARILRLLSGRSHRVVTGVAVVTANSTEVAAEVTGVRFLTLSDAEIEAYVATGEPMDKAGAYGIQGRAACWIPRIEGCYFNVMGLPLALVSSMLASVDGVERS